MSRAVAARGLAATLLATVFASCAALAVVPGERIRIIGPDRTGNGWPATEEALPGFVEAGREPSAPVRALPMLPQDRAMRASAERAAAFELAEMLRAARDRGEETAFPADFAIAAAPAGQSGPDGRLRPEHILFDAPNAIRAHAPPPGEEPSAGAVPVPDAAPRATATAAAPIPRAHPRRPIERALAAPAAPVPRPAPRTAEAGPPAATIAAAAVAPTVAEPAGPAPILAGDPAAPTPGTVPWERTGAAGSARAAAATPFITLWPSSSAPEDGGNAPSGGNASAIERDEPLPPGPEPYALVRMLTALQDDIARGSGAALAAQGVLQRRLEERFATALPREWADPRNARALVIYALSGGNPAVVRRVVDGSGLMPPFDVLAAGALAYLEGRASDARRHFAAVEGEALDASVAGSVWLARAALAVETDPKAALALLEEARAAAPGTLVEEAALRRALLVAAEMDDIATVERIVARYLRKFRRSLYAGNFRQRFAASVTRMSFVREPAAFVRLEAMVEEMTDAGRQELYLLLARAAIESGNRLAAKIAADRALATAVPGTLDARRAALYRAAAEVVEPERFEAAVATLRELEESDLPQDDRAILFAALRLSRTVAELPPPVRGRFAAPLGADDEGEDAVTDAMTDALPADGSDAEFGATFDVAAVERRVAEALDRIDALLEDTP